MPVGIDFIESGSSQVSAELLRFSGRLADPRPALLEIAEGLRQTEAKHFDEEGPGWAPLAATTLARKSAQGYPADILQMTGQLRESLTQSGGDNIAVIQRDELIFGTSDPKAAFHQHETQNMPARPPLIVDLAERVMAIKIIQRYFVEGMIRP